MKKIRFRLPVAVLSLISFTTPLRLILATCAVFWMGTAQPQVPDSQGKRDAAELRLRDFFRTPVGPNGLEVSDALRDADGRTVRLVGYMVQQESPAPGRFMLTPRPVQMSEHADGDADDLPPATVVVYLDPSQKDWVVPHVRGLVSVRGRLSVSRFEETDGRVSWVRLQLEPEATRGMSATELAQYLHDSQHGH